MASVVQAVLGCMRRGQADHRSICLVLLLVVVICTLTTNMSVLCMWPTCRLLLKRPTQLALVKGEGYGSCTRKLTDKVKHDLIPGKAITGGLAFAALMSLESSHVSQDHLR
jgi:hypothetical protein